MRFWIKIFGLIVVAMASVSLSAQSPVLSGAQAPYSALQNSQPIHLAGNSYGAGMVAYGPVGTPLVLSGSNLGNNGAVWFISYKNGAINSNVAPVRASVSLWSPTAIILTVPAGATSGLIRVIRDNQASNGLPFIVMPGIYSGKCSVTPPLSVLQIATSSLQDGALNQPYSAQLQATGGTKGYNWSLASGSLPAGLSLSSSGALSGTPASASGQQLISVQVSDSGVPPQHDVAILSIEISSQAEAQSSSAPYSFTVQNVSGSSGYDVAGNVTSYIDSVNGNWAFTYDALNRLATASGSQRDNPYPNLCWQYDTFGNRLAQTSSASAFDSSVGGANACPVTAGPNFWATYNVSNTNRIDASSQNANQSSYYDAAGNISYDGINSYLYDGEGRICAMQQSVAGIRTMTQYLYDAGGNRVAKGSISSWSCDTTSNGFTATTVFVLGLHNEQMTELTWGANGWQWEHTNVEAGGLSATYNADRSGVTEGPLYFHLSDWLATRRQQTDYAGNPVLNFAGLPYGDGLQAIPVSNLDVADGTEQHFTGKERDTESGNDYFGARYYSSMLGRFLSPDWSSKEDPIPYAQFEDPQSLNLYSYVRNNPNSHVDPDGHCCESDFNSFSDHPGMFTGGSAASDRAFLQQAFAPITKFMADHPQLTDVIVNAAFAVMTRGEGGRIEWEGGDITPSASTMRSAQREAMRSEGIPTSQQPSSQVETPAGRQYTYEVPQEGGGTQTKVVQRNKGTDRSHPGQPHVEAGTPKEKGQVDKFGRPRLNNNKTKVNVRQPNGQ